MRGYDDISVGLADPPYSVHKRHTWLVFVVVFFAFLAYTATQERGSISVLTGYVVTGQSENTSVTEQAPAEEPLVTDGEIIVELAPEDLLAGDLPVEEQPLSELAEETIQYPAEINKPVRWVKRIHSRKTVELPEGVENVRVKKISNGVEEEIAHKASISRERAALPTPLTGFAVQEPTAPGLTLVEIEEAAEEVTIEYETEAPQVYEEEITPYRKRVTVSSNVHYENVSAYTSIMESNRETILLYWIVNDSRQLVENAFYDDTNANGFIDRIVWQVPSLSNQTYELIIAIIRAQHLNGNYSFISDVYNETRARDGIWSEEIPNTHYLRATFESNLTSNNDITIYPRIMSGTPRVEVYEKDSATKIAEFASITSDQYNKILLTNLVGEQDTFDLRIVGGSLQFDHVVDPETVYTILFQNFESGWETSTSNACDATPDCTQTGGFNNCNAASNDYLFCASSDTNPDASHTDSYGLLTEDWDGGSVTATDGIWYNFNAATACGGSQCTYITVRAWIFENGMDNGENCWVTEQFDAGTPAAIITIDVSSGAYALYEANLSNVGSSDTNVRIMCKMNNAADEVFWDEFNITGYISSGGGGGDTALPTWSNMQRNETIVNRFMFVNFTTAWTDVTALAAFIFSINQSTEFMNSSLRSFGGEPASAGSSNVSQITAPVGTNVSWRFYANDTVNSGFNMTFIESFIVANRIPNVTNISTVLPQSITEGGASKLSISFIAFDSDGAGDLNRSSARINISTTENPARYNNSCAYVSDIGSFAVNFTCIVDVWYFDAAGNWSIRASIRDNSSALTVNESVNFTLLPTLSIAIGPDVLSFLQIYPLTANVTATNDPITVNNTGNVNVTTNNTMIRSYDLVGQQTLAHIIPASNFTVDVNTGAGDPECGVQSVMANNTYRNVTTSIVPRGNNTAGANPVNGVELLYFCLRGAPAGGQLPSQTYSASGGAAWIIEVGA